MRTTATIHYNGKYVSGGPQMVLDAAHCGPDVAVIEHMPNIDFINVTVTLDTTDERLRVLLNLLFEHNISWLEIRKDHFTEKELEHARLIMMWADNHHEILGGPRLGTSYDLNNACQTCGAGAAQTSPMMIDEDEVPKIEGRRASVTYYSDILVDERLARELDGLNVKGLSFRSVYAKKKDGRQTKLRWKQLVAARSMPPISIGSTGVLREYPCASCKRSGYVTWPEEPARLAYRLQDLRDIDDVMTTWEWFGVVYFNGNINEAVLPYPWFLVTPKVWRAFRDAGVETFDWLPIRMVDSDD